MRRGIGRALTCTVSVALGGTAWLSQHIGDLDTPESRDAFYLREKYEREFATNPAYVEMYRRGNAYHGAHPFYMWYWGQRGREKLSRVIVVGADNVTVPALMGWETADSLAEAP